MIILFKLGLLITTLFSTQYYSVHDCTCTHTTNQPIPILFVYALKKRPLDSVLWKPSIYDSFSFTFWVMWDTTIHPLGAQCPRWHTFGQRSDFNTIPSQSHSLLDIVKFRAIVAQCALAGPNFASLLGLHPPEKVSILCC